MPDMPTPDDIAARIPKDPNAPVGDYGIDQDVEIAIDVWSEYGDRDLGGLTLNDDEIIGRHDEIIDVLNKAWRERGEYASGGRYGIAAGKITTTGPDDAEIQVQVKTPKGVIDDAVRFDGETAMAELIELVEKKLAEKHGIEWWGEEAPEDYGPGDIGLTPPGTESLP